MNVRGSSSLSASSRFVNRTFSPVFVDRFSIRNLDPPARPASMAIRANWSASGSLHRRRVIAPRPPEKISSGAQPCRKSSAPRSHDLVVTAQDENGVGVRQLMIQLMVIPDRLDQRARVRSSRIGPITPLHRLLSGEEPIDPAGQVLQVRGVAARDFGRHVAGDSRHRPARAAPRASRCRLRRGSSRRTGRSADRAGSP